MESSHQSKPTNVAAMKEAEQPGATSSSCSLEVPPPQSSPLPQQKLKARDDTERTIPCELSFSDDSDSGEEEENVNNGVATAATAANGDILVAKEATTTAAPAIKRTSSDSSDSIELSLDDMHLSNEESLLAAEAFTFASNMSGLSQKSAGTTTAITLGEGSVIGPRNLLELVACPCCSQEQQQSQSNSFESLSSPPHPQSNQLVAALNDKLPVSSNNTNPNRNPGATESARKAGSLLSDSEDDDDDLVNHEDEPEDVLPGVLAAGVEYNIKRILVEGWLHKKGTGKDWLGSKGWKARWARLCLARVDGYQNGVDVPLLLISWYPTGTLVSTPTVILLDSTVVLAVDAPNDKDNSSNKKKGTPDTSSNKGGAPGWNAYRFEIRHASTRENATMPTTRTFCAPQKARDAWLYAISQALLMHAKQKDRVRRKQLVSSNNLMRTIETKSPTNAGSTAASNAKSASPDRPSSPPVYGEVWTGDRFVTVETRSAATSPVHRGSSTSPLPPSCSSPPPFPSRALSPPASPKLPRPTPVHGSGSRARPPQLSSSPPPQHVPSTNSSD